MNVYSQQHEKCTIPIHFNDSVALFDGILNQTNEVVYDDSVLYKITLYDCRGHSKMMIYESNGALIAKGTFKNSLDTLKIYSNLFNELTGQMEMTVYPHFEALKDGWWYYFSENEEVSERRFYENGNYRFFKD
jgi:hypothetical protein